MKKFSISLLCCLILCLGVFAFGGCNNLPSVQNISIATTPTKTSYLIGEQLDLTGGILKVTYNDGSTTTLPLSVATPNQYNFNSAGEKIITVSFQQKTTTFGVSVSKRDIQLSPSFSIPNAYYTGEQLPIDLTTLNTITLGPDSTYTTEYKLSHQLSDEFYTDTAPTSVGTYTVRIQIQGGSTFNDMTLDNNKAIITNYNILPTTLPQLSTLNHANGITLEYNLSQYTGYTYGDDMIDFSKCWVIGSNKSGKLEYGSAPLPQQFASQLKYWYRTKGATEWTEITGIDTKEQAFNAGEYEIKVTLQNVDNVQNYETNEIPFVVNQKQLALGKDYYLRAFGNNAEWKLNPETPENNSLPYNEGITYSVSPRTEDQSITLELVSVKYIDSNSKINSLPPSNAGTYTAECVISAGKNYQPTTQSVRFTIYKANITIPTIDDVSYEFDQSAKKFYVNGLDIRLTYTVQYAVQGSTQYSADAPEDEGTYSVKITFSFVNETYKLNYNIVDQNEQIITDSIYRTLTITPNSNTI